MKIFIATPMYGGNAKYAYVTSYSNLITGLINAGHQPVTMTLTNESLVTRARNTLANEFLNTDCDALLFIDADHSFDTEDAIKMIESGKDMIGAVYPMKGINWDVVRGAIKAGKEDLDKYTGKFAFNFLEKDSQEINSRDAFKVKDIGTGFLYISRKVFETVTPLCKNYLTYGGGANGGIDRSQIVKHVEFFYTHIDDEHYLVSEDFSFCKLWRSTGGDVWAAPWVKITHMGDYNFSGSFANYLELRYQQLNEKQ